MGEMQIKRDADKAIEEIMREALAIKDAEIERLNKVLAFYGGHKSWCASRLPRRGRGCNCGWHHQSPASEIEENYEALTGEPMGEGLPKTSVSGDGDD